MNTLPVTDVTEAIAPTSASPFSINNCPDCQSISDTWSYSIDSFNDSVRGDYVGPATQNDTGEYIGPANSFELYALGIKQVGDTIIVAVNSDQPLEGFIDEDIASNDNLIGWGDLIINQTGKNLADAQTELTTVRFFDYEDPGAELDQDTGIFNGASTQSITGSNGLAVESVDAYIKYVELAPGTSGGPGVGTKPSGAIQGNHSFGDLPTNSTYFDRTKTIDNVTASGQHAGDVELLDANNPLLSDLNFQSQGAIGEHTFAFAFDATSLEPGEAVFHLAPECGNDIITFKGFIPFEPGIDIEKLTNTEDADTLEDAIPLNPGNPLKWTYQVTNTGNVPFLIDDITVVDDLEGTPTLVASDESIDGILSPGEQIQYEIIAPNGAENLMRSLNFETRPDGTPLNRGDLLAEAYADWGVTLSTDIENPEPGDEGPWPAMVFDTAEPTGGDTDLGSPNQDFEGEGEGAGGAADSPYRNNRPLGNIAIISEDDDASDPDDHKKGGTLRFDFDTPVFLEWAEILDASKTGSIVTFDDTGAVINEYVISPDAENDPFRDRNNFQSYPLNKDFASAVEFQFKDSAGLANLVFTEYYQNTATVTISDQPISDEDTSTYITENPSFILEKSTNGKDADRVEDAAVVAPGEPVTWHYRLFNDGNVAFNGADISVVDDDPDVVLTLDATTDTDGVLSPGEEWTYVGEGLGHDLSFAVDFDTDAANNPLAAGTVIDTEYQEVGVTVSTPGHAHGAMIFDTAHVTGDDWDLLDPNIKNGGDDLLGNVLILSEDGSSDNPDDNADGGTVRFEFNKLLGISGVNLFDIDAHESVEIRTFDASGDLLATSVFEGAGNNMRQTADINSGLIAALEVELTGSGAIAGLEGDRVYSNTAMATINGVPDVMASDSSFYVN